MKISISRILLGITLLTSLALGDVFVKNKPFKGEVSGRGSSTMVEAEPMLKILSAENFSIESNVLKVNGKTITMEGSMVSLKALTEALGAKMLVNQDLGTVDVYKNTAKVSASSPSQDSNRPRKPGYVKPPQGWLTSWEQASNESQRSGKPILLNFTGSDWCGWCIKLKKEVFSTDEFKTWAERKVVLLEVDFPRRKQLPPALTAQNQQLAQQFGVRGYPSVYFADHTGKQIGGKYGYDEGGPSVWTKRAESIFSR